MMTTTKGFAWKSLKGASSKGPASGDKVLLDPGDHVVCKAVADLKVPSIYQAQSEETLKSGQVDKGVCPIGEVIQDQLA